MATAMFSSICRHCAPAVVAALVTVCYGATVAILCLVAVPEPSRPLVDAAMSLMGTVWSGSVAFMIGARSLGSLRKVRPPEDQAGN